MSENTQLPVLFAHLCVAPCFSVEDSSVLCVNEDEELVELQFA